MARGKYYAVKRGKTPGVYLTWEECREQVHGVAGAVYKSFPTREEAEAYVSGSTVSGDTEAPVEDGMSGTLSELEDGAAVAYVDGSYDAATKEYSCGVVFLVGAEEIRFAKKGESAELASMRNVAGELLGAELAMRKALELGIKKLSIYHDYQGIASWCLGEWKTNKEGTKAYKEYYDSIRDEIEIRFVKVKGHSGDTYNDLADALAKGALGKGK